MKHMYEFTAFKSIFDNATNKTYSFQTWEQFESAFYKMSKIPGYKPKRGEKPTKKASPLISPACFKRGTNRANANVTHWSRWAALDIDDYKESFENTLSRFSNYSYVCYSSASSTKEHPKFRIILQLTSEVPAEKIRHFWYALNKEFNDVADPQTKDLSRMYYVPAQYPDAYNFIFTNKGNEVLNPDKIMEQHPYVESPKDLLSKLPLEMQHAVMQFKKNSLTNTSVDWSSYRDCPFINKTLIDQYRKIAFTDGTGRYTFFYKIMVNIAGNAIRAKYPITAFQIAGLAREIDKELGNRYSRRPLETEANRALTYVMRSKCI